MTDNDDAVIHLRLGDALSNDNDQGIGLLPHDAYLTILRKIRDDSPPGQTIDSIGIVTQSFEKGQGRRYDEDPETLAKSKAFAQDLVEAMQREFPHATIRIHNDQGETPLKSMIRLIKARKVAICGASTFCTLPVLSNVHGKGYLYRAPKHSPWAYKVTQAYPDRLVSFTAPRLTNNFIHRLDIDAVRTWLNVQRADIGNVVVSEYPLIRNDHPMNKEEQ